MGTSRGSAQSFSRNSLDPDPDSMNMDPKHWENPFIFILIFLWFAVRNDKTKNRVQAKKLSFTQQLPVQDPT